MGLFLSKILASFSVALSPISACHLFTSINITTNQNNIDMKCKNFIHFDVESFFINARVFILRAIGVARQIVERDDDHIAIIYSTPQGIPRGRPSSLHREKTYSGVASIYG